MRKLCLILGLAALAVLAGCSSDDKAGKNDGGTAEAASYINISLGSNCFEGYCWSYTAGKPGIVLEVPYETIAPQTTRENADGTVTLTNELIPGNQHFFFVGVAEGEVELDFVRSSPAGDQPSASARYKIQVLPDLDLKILERQENLNN